MSNTPLLALTNYSREYIIEIDINQGGIGVVLMQGDRPIVDFSNRLALKQNGRSIYE